MQISLLLHEATSNLIAAGVDNPALDARVLAAHVLGKDRAWLAAHGGDEVTAEAAASIAALIARRVAHEPVARILGKREFWGLDFVLTSATLEPRPDSETLVRAVIEQIPTHSASLRILDIGTGTGCLLLALLNELPSAVGTGIDIAPEAVSTANSNATALGLHHRSNFMVGNWLDGVSAKFDVIISNPPYIPSGDIVALMKDVRDYDPLAALDGGDDGLTAYRAIIPQLPVHLERGGLVALEHGHDQAEDVAALLNSAGFDSVKHYSDYGGNSRCVIARIN